MRLRGSESRFIKRVYERLLGCYGKQGWWPLVSMAGKPGFDTRGYHARDYSFPRTGSKRFEIALGAILTQNTTWKNAEKGLASLARHLTLSSVGRAGEGLFSPKAISDLREDELAGLIRSCGYFNQKARKILILARFFRRLSGRAPEREELLGLWGIGCETADSILLYAFGKPYFVVDAYTRRIFSRLCVIQADAEYDEIRSLFEGALGRDPGIYNEYHALVVAHAKGQCMKNPDCGECPLGDLCGKRLTARFAR